MSGQTASRQVGTIPAAKSAEKQVTVQQFEGAPQLINQRIARYFSITAIKTSVGPNSVIDILPSSEEGELLGFIFDCDNPNMIIEVVLSGDSSTSYNLNDLSVADMVSQGRGLSAGDAPNLPSGQSQDVHGSTNNVFPYVSRYKNDVVADFAGITAPRFTVMYTPSVPTRYVGLSVRVRNNDPSAAGTMNSLILNRIVYVQERKMKERTKGYKPYVGEQYQIQNP